MSFFRACCRVLALPLAVAMLFVSIPLSAVKAEMVTTEQILQSNGSIGDREKVARFLEHKVVREQMVRLGVDPTEVESRIAALSDQEITQIAGQIDQLPAGQATTNEIVLYVLAVVGIIFLIILVLAAL